MYNVINEHGELICTTAILSAAILVAMEFVLVEPYFSTLSLKARREAALEWVTEHV